MSAANYLGGDALTKYEGTRREGGLSADGPLLSQRLCGLSDSACSKRRALSRNV